MYIFSLSTSRSHAASSSEIRGALKNEELRKLICNINCSADAENVSAISSSLR